MSNSACDLSLRPAKEEQPYGFPFMKLPPELQDEIWTMTLRTARKVFHVDTSVASASDPAVHHLIFHYTHAPPVTVHVCTQARAAARRAGFVPFPQPGDAPPVWFHAHHDILFLDARSCGLLLGSVTRGTAPSLALVPALREIRHVGIAQGIMPRNCSSPIEFYKGGVVYFFWAALMDIFQASMPNLAELHFLSPLVTSWDGRAVDILEGTIEPLDPGATVYRRRRGPTYTWDDVHQEFVKALEALALPRGVPPITAWRLKRQHPLRMCHSRIVRHQG